MSGTTLGGVKRLNLIPQASVCTAQTDVTSSTTLVDVTGLKATVLAGQKYVFRAHITGTAGASGGAKIALGGTATATSVSYTGVNSNGTTGNARTTTTTLGAAVGGANAIITDMTLEGAIVVATSGTLTVQIAQNTSNGTTTSAYVNSDFIVTKV